MRWGLLFLVSFVAIGCEHILPADIQPVSKERCEKLAMYDLGKVDSLEGYRRGVKYEWWYKDCAFFGVILDRSAYDKGYDEGLREYCSCEAGFTAGLKSEFLEIKRLYPECKDEQKKAMHWAHAKGDSQKNDDTLMQKTSTLKVNYYEDKILARAKEVCSQAPSQ